MLKQIKSLYGSAKRAILTLYYRRKFKADKETSNKRNLFCKDCQFMRKKSKYFVFWNKPTCEVCGCYIHLKIKLAFEVCPKNKW